MMWKFRKMRHKKLYREHMSSWEDDYKLNKTDFIVIYDKYENKGMLSCVLLPADRG